MRQFTTHNPQAKRRLPNRRHPSLVATGAPRPLISFSCASPAAPSDADAVAVAACVTSLHEQQQCLVSQGQTNTRIELPAVGVRAKLLVVDACVESLACWIGVRTKHIEGPRTSVAA